VIMRIWWMNGCGYSIWREDRGYYRKYLQSCLGNRMVYLYAMNGTSGSETFRSRYRAECLRWRPTDPAKFASISETFVVMSIRERSRWPIWNWYSLVLSHKWLLFKHFKPRRVCNSLVCIGPFWDFPHRRRPHSMCGRPARKAHILPRKMLTLISIN